VDPKLKELGLLTDPDEAALAAYEHTRAITASNNAAHA